MTTKEALKVLKDHQVWRMGGEGPQTTPKLLTEATNIAIKLLEEKVKQKT